MFLLSKRKNTRVIGTGQQESSEIIAAKEYLNKTHPTLFDDEEILGKKRNFYYVESSENGKYIRHYFCEGLDDRIIFVVLCEEERKSVIELFKQNFYQNIIIKWFGEEMNNYVNEHYGDFVYKDSLKGRVTGGEVLHRFYSSKREVALLMDEDGYIYSISTGIDKIADLD